jgi:hypothetical protein
MRKNALAVIVAVVALALAVPLTVLAADGAAAWPRSRATGSPPGRSWPHLNFAG